MIINDDYRKAREEAIEWINSQARDFSQGVAILSKSGFKPIVAANLARKGEKPYTREKLEFEMRQMLQVWYNPNDPIYEDVDLSDDAEPGEDGRPETLTAEQDNGMLQAANDEDSRQGDEQPALPKVMASLIYEFRNLYVERDKLHRSLAEMGESNQQAVVEKRQVLVKRIADISERMKYIHALRTAYEQNKVLPDNEQLDKAYGRAPIKPLKDDPNKSKTNEPLSDADAFNAMTVEELKRAKVNAQSKVTKARNMLLYGSEKKQEVENPMPDCPNRVKYERKIAQQQALIQKIDYRLAELSYE